MRRALGAAAVAGALIMSAPGAAVATTNCSVVVCATADTSAGWSCEVEVTPYGYGLLHCSGSATGVGEGSSPLSIPGSLTWAGSTGCTLVTPYGDYDCGAHDVEPGTTCTWAGLGEDTCGGTIRGEITGWTIYVPLGSCFEDFYADTDLQMWASVGSAVAKSLPVLGPIDTATASSSSVGSFLDLPDDQRCVPA